MALPISSLPFLITIGMGLFVVSMAARRSNIAAFGSAVATTTRHHRCHHCSTRSSLPPYSFVVHDRLKQRGRVASQQQIKLFTTSSSTAEASTYPTDAKGGGSLNPTKVVQDMLYRIRQVNDIPEEIRQSLLLFVVDGIAVGKVRPGIAELLSSIDSSIFQIVPMPDDPKMNILTLGPAAGTTNESRTAAVSQVTQTLREQGQVPGWRDELYPIARGFYQCGEEPLFSMERAAVPWIGAMQYGVHINGLVTAEDGNTLLWMARRSKTKSKYPGMLDHIVAGGQPTGISLWDNCIKECWEEAGMPPELTSKCLRAAGAVSYDTYEPEQDVISRAVLFCYDLHLPRDFVPKVVDGEVEEFFLWTIPQVMASMAPDFSDPIKPNCYNVIIDYLLRAGHVSPDTPGYLDVLRELRSGECY